MSRLILDHMIEKNDLMPIFQSHGLTRNDVTFIKEIILGHSLDGEGMEFKGRPAAKHFLYEVHMYIFISTKSEHYGNRELIVFAINFHEGTKFSHYANVANDKFSLCMKI